MLLREGVKKTLTFRGRHIYPIKGGGSTPLLLKKVEFFQTKLKKYSAYPENPYLLKKSLFSSPSLSIDSNKILKKNGRR